MGLNLAQKKGEAEQILPPKKSTKKDIEKEGPLNHRPKKII